MSVVSSSQFELIRARNELQKACKQGNWDAVRRWDSQLGESLNSAFDDEYRDTKSLISELEKILSVYSNLVSNLPHGLADKVLFTDG